MRNEAGAVVLQWCSSGVAVVLQWCYCGHLRLKGRPRASFSRLWRESWREMSVLVVALCRNVHEASSEFQLLVHSLRLQASACCVQLTGHVTGVASEGCLHAGFTFSSLEVVSCQPVCAVCTDTHLCRLHWLHWHAVFPLAHPSTGGSIPKGKKQT